MSCVEGVCDQDQNWIEQSRLFWGSDQGIKVACKLLKSERVLQLDLWPLKIKCSRASEGLIKSADQTVWSWLQTLQQATNKWPPFVMPHHKCHCRCSPFLFFHLQLTPRNLSLLRKTLSNIYTRRKQMIHIMLLASFLVLNHNSHWTPSEASRVVSDTVSW